MSGQDFKPTAQALLDAAGVAMVKACGEIEQSLRAYRVIHGSQGYFGRIRSIWAPLSRAEALLTIPEIVHCGPALTLLLDADQRAVEELVHNPINFDRWDGKGEYLG